ncbi:uncharacterized protein LOC108905714 [Anoplophora glabripennis]|uniref:uncharacterized protein LOC108905714 n=1 Tax=Anoplophora glabripennis TaxID=217634 RepID=UPI0008749FB0|nr:uncharacterized protein LOC108905714 [Anoplophora glabripennis]
MRYSLVSIFLVCSLGFSRGDAGQPGSNINSSPQQSSYTEDDSDMYMEDMDHQPQGSTVQEQKEQQESENSFYPAFSQSLGHSRPFLEYQEGAYSQRAQPPFQQVFEAPVRFAGFKEGYHQSASNPAPKTHDLLGSGNFGVIKGGTFYNENDAEQAEQTAYSDFSEFFHNGHGRPSFYGGRPNPKPYKHEQFANFKDFADINTPSDRQYSQYVVVYVNKNGTEEPAPMNKPIHNKPNNIIESLALLDLESDTTTEPEPEKKMSKSKRKLALLPPEKKHRAKLAKKENLTKELSEPLLALS